MVFLKPSVLRVQMHANKAQILSPDVGLYLILHVQSCMVFFCFRVCFLQKSLILVCHHHCTNISGDVSVNVSQIQTKTRPKLFSKEKSLKLPHATFCGQRTGKKNLFRPTSSGKLNRPQNIQVVLEVPEN